MARKGNQQKNGVDPHTPKRKKKGPDFVPSSKQGSGEASEVKIFPGEQLPNGNRQLPNGNRPDDDNIKQNNGKSEKQMMDNVEQCTFSGDTSRDFNEEYDGTSDWNFGPKRLRSNLSGRLNSFHAQKLMERIQTHLDNVVVKNVREYSSSILREVVCWLEKNRPFMISVSTNIYKARDHVKTKFKQVYPVVLTWMMHIGNLFLFLSLLWLDCMLRGLDSFLRMGTTSFFSIIWCSILSVVAMVGMSKFLMIMAIAALTAVFIGFTLGILVIAVSGSILLWLYGSFWTTMLFIFLGGLAFMLSRERLTSLIITTYSLYSAWTYVGWLGLFLAFNLSFLSSDVLIYFLKNNVNHQRRAERSTEGEPSDRGPGVASTSGVESELTSEEEVTRLLNCTDHYSAFGLSRFENVDLSYIKREYRKKAMLVHPDKNMGNEKAAEAFKKLQNAYEVLLDSVKRKTYDDEMRREELLNYFTKFQNASQMNGMAQSDTDADVPLGESRRIACKKCSGFHLWVQTNKLKSRARWCQDCNDFHQAKDGDGWVEQISQPVMFGLLQKADAPTAFVCADSRIYNATEWYICQGMRCPANTHKTSFHVNTSVTSKHNSSSNKGQRRPTEETMTEDEFFEWLQNAVQAGVFDNVAEQQPPPPSSGFGFGNFTKNSSGSSSSSKRKKKGKRH